MIEFTDYVFYIRVSKGDQDVETQELECKRFTRAREGKPYEYMLYNEGTVSTRVKMKKRPQLMLMLDNLQKGQTVVVFKLDRLSRDVVEMVTIYRMIKAKGCKIISLNDPDCEDEFIIGIMGVLAQKERKDISLRTKAKHRAKRSAGERVSRFPPYGFCDHEDGKHFLRVDREQEALALMYRYRDEGMTLREIAQVLADRGYMNREGRQFQSMTLYRILCRREETKSLDQLQEARV